MILFMIPQHAPYLTSKSSVVTMAFFLAVLIDILPQQEIVQQQICQGMRSSLVLKLMVYRMIQSFHPGLLACLEPAGPLVFKELVPSSSSTCLSSSVHHSALIAHGTSSHAAHHSATNVATTAHITTLEIWGLVKTRLALLAFRTMSVCYDVAGQDGC